MHSTPYRLRDKVSRASMYKSKGYYSYGIYLCFVYLSRYEIIIFECHLVTRNELLVGRNQTFSLVKLLISSLVLVKIYWLDDQDLPLVLY